MTQNQTAAGPLRSLVAPLVISATLVAPFIGLQWINRRTLQEDFPFVLFTFMSLHALFTRPAGTQNIEVLSLSSNHFELVENPPLIHVICKAKKMA